MKRQTRLAKQLIEGVEAPAKLKRSDFVSSGSVNLNLAMTGKPTRGFGKGSYTLLVGDSHAGKTMIALTAMAEAANNPEFDNYQLVYDATTEDGAQMDIAKMFGSKLASRLKIVRSSTAEEFYYRADSFVKKGPMFLVCDSENGLDSEAATDKFEQNKKAHEQGKEEKGSYGDGKAKIHSSSLRRLCGDVKRNGSILIITSQTRDNIDPMSFETKTRSGGRALKFYAQVEPWMAVKKKLTVTVNGKARQIGIIASIQVKKSRWTGKVRTADVIIYYSVGVDDVGSMIHFLIEEGHWTGSGVKVAAPEFGFNGSINKLVETIQEDDSLLVKKLTGIVFDVWNEIESKCEVKRKSRYE